MPTNLTANPATFPDQSAPVPGEPRTAGSVQTPFQNAADRAAYLKDRLDHLDPNKEGARRLRRFANIAALQASVDIPNASVCIVDGVGLYEYFPASALSEAVPTVVKPTSVGVDPGAWIAIWLGAMGVANGIAQLDGAGKLPTSRLACGDAQGRIAAGTVRGSVADFQSSYNGASPQTTSGSFVDVGAPQITVPALEGDRLKISLSMRAYNLTNGKLAQYQVVVVNPDTSVNVVDGSAQYFTSTDEPRAGIFSYPINATGNYLVKLQHKQYDGGTSNLTGITLITELYRP